METLRSRYHDFGNKINTALMGVGMAKQYISVLAADPAHVQILKDATESCLAAERALLQLDVEMAKLKAVTYRLIHPDKDIKEYSAGIHKENSAIRILVVDDEKDVCLLVKCFYEQRGFKVDWAVSGESAIQKINDAVPHIVILDLYLHGRLEGVDVLRHLKSVVPSAKCVIVTSEADAGRRKDAEALKPDAVLVKPVSPATLDARINGFIAELKV